MKWRIALIFILIILLSGAGIFLVRRGSLFVRDTITETREKAEQLDPAAYFTGLKERAADGVHQFQNRDFSFDLFDRVDFSGLGEKYFHKPLEEKQQELVDRLEEEYGLQFVFSEVEFWPLNQLTFKEVTISGQEADFRAATVEVNYRLLDILRAPEDWLAGITSVYLGQPELEITAEGSSGIEEPVPGEKSGVETFFDFLEIERGDFLYSLQQLDIYLHDGLIEYYDTGSDTRLCLAGIDGLLELASGREHRLTLQTDLEVSELAGKEHYIEQLQLDDVYLDLALNNREWQGDVVVDSFDPGLIVDTSLQNMLEEELQLDIDNLYGRTRAVVNMRGRETEINEVRAQLDLEGTGFSIGQQALSSPQAVTDLQGRVFFDLGAEKIFAEDMKFSLAGSRYQFSGVVEELFAPEPEIGGSLQTDNFRAGALKLEEMQLQGSGEFELMVGGNLTSPRLRLDGFFPLLEVEDQEFRFLEMNARYDRGLIFIDHFEGNRGYDNQIELTGMIDSSDWKYSLNVSGRKLGPELLVGLERFGGPTVPEELTGRLGGDFLVSGQGITAENVNIRGEVSIDEVTYAEYPPASVQAEIWLAGDRLYLGEGFLQTEPGEIDFAGEINLSEKDLDIQLEGRKLVLPFLLETAASLTEAEMPFEREEVKGLVAVSGHLGGTPDKPRLEISTSIEEGNYQQLKTEMVEFDLVFERDLLRFSNLLVRSGEIAVRGDGRLNLAADSPEVEAQLALEELSVAGVNEIIADQFADSGVQLPLRGQLVSSLEIGGTIASPEIRGELTSQAMELIYEEHSYQLSEVKGVFSWQSQQPLQVEELSLEKGDSRFVIQGQYSEEQLDLSYRLQDMELALLEPLLSLTGTVSVSGGISGSLSGPVITAELNAGRVGYQNYVVEDIFGSLEYRDDVLEVKSMEGFFGQSLYRTRGSIYSLTEDPELNVEVTTTEGDLNYFAELLNADLFLENSGEQFSFAGGARLRGPLLSPQANIELRGFSPRTAEPRFMIRGQVAEEIDLYFYLRELVFRREVGPEAQPMELAGRADIAGNVGGSFAEVDLAVDTEITDLSLGQYQIPLITGKINLGAGRELLLEQEIIFSEDNIISVGGRSTLNNDPKVDIDVNVEHFPLEFLAREMDAVALEGFLQGDVTIGGTLEEPEMGGSLYVYGQELETVLPETITTMEGDLVFSGQEVELADFYALYAGEKIDLAGKVNLLQPDDFWQLSLGGDNLLFDRGPYSGRFDAQLEVTGPFYSPLFAGEALVYDFVAQTPLDDWDPLEGESPFSPRAELVLHPGEDVYFRSDDRINILVERGRLTLYYDEEVALDGELRSEEGTFVYYNNKFELERATALFHRHQGHMPRVSVNAYTMVESTRINTLVTGTAENMVISFDSMPPLEENEIYSLLARRGGLGEIVYGEDATLVSAARQEFMRFLQETFQLEFVEGWSARVRDFLELDTFVIDTYDFGLDERIQVEMGKEFTNRLYLEYSSSITPDYRDDEFSFKYRLGENTFLDGTWRVDDDYRISLETIMGF